MKPEIDIHKEPELALNSLLDEINKQRRLNSELQSELRTMRTREIRLNKNSEILKSDNNRLKQDLTILEQKLRELEIQLTLPESDRTFVPARPIEPFPRKPFYKKINWAYVIVPIIVIGAIGVFKWQSNKNIAAQTAAVAATATNTEGGASAAPQPEPSGVTTPVATSPTPIANNNTPQTIEEGYLMIQNPLDNEGMVRVMDGYTQKARVLAWINPGEKYRIRAQSPTKMRRTYVKDGKNVTFEDYFYKISDKEQWVFGYFTTKKLAQ
ncbi:MAG: hypothetical protein JNL70_04635 [Saprospiraceae bacterium]|nr:hypothetical protein [Saprospiraceae bacterium]